MEVFGSIQQNVWHKFKLLLLIKYEQLFPWPVGFLFTDNFAMERNNTLI